MGSAEGCTEANLSSVVLASTSPRRLDLLRLVGIEPVVHAVEIDETPHAGESPAAMVERLAVEKAVAAWRDGVEGGHPSWAGEASPLLLAADTTIDLDGVSLGKPVDEADARVMLQALSGRTHEVYSGVAMMVDGACQTIVERTVVRFITLSEDDLDWYISTGEPHGKAGSYTIQGVATWMVEHMEGSYHNVVGLPLAALDSLTRTAGWPLRRLSNRFSPVESSWG